MCVCVYSTNLISVHELLADDVLTDAGGRHQVMELVEELHTALMVLRCSFIQLIPQDKSHTLRKKTWRLNRVKTIQTIQTNSKYTVTINELCTLKKLVLSAMYFRIP